MSKWQSSFIYGAPPLRNLLWLQVLVELMRVKAGQQMEESQLRYNLQVLQQQYRETTALVSEGRRTLNGLRPTLNSNRRKVWICIARVTLLTEERKRVR